MDKIVVLIALGPNDVAVPCRFFPDMETGLARTKELLGVEPVKIAAGYRFDIDLEDATMEAISDSLFTRWYYGCGGVYGFNLQEVPFDTKFLGFDLD